MDAFAISLGASLAAGGPRRADAFRAYALRASLFFGGFQFLMPVAGWYLGRLVAGSRAIRAVDHWVAFGLLGFIGGKMIRDALRRDALRRDAPGGGDEPAVDVRSLATLLTLAVATSVDALAVGLSFSVLGRDIWGPAAIIGAVTFAVCVTGFEAGRRLGPLIGRRAGLAGGAALVGVGAKILIEHLTG